MKIKLFSSIALIIAAIIFFPLSQHLLNSPAHKTEQVAVKATPKPNVTVKLTSVGDFLMHLPIIRSAYDSSTQTYNFVPIFEPVSEYLQSADLTIGNLETRMAGAEKGYSGYPRFNCPTDLAKDLKNLGIDILTLANNHCLDMGWSGFISTMDNLDNIGMEYIGNARSPEERNKFAIQDVKGIKLGFLNYTETTNGIPVPAGKEYAVNMIDMEVIKKDVEELKNKQVDMVIVCLHFGTEYKRNPTEEQKIIAQQVFAAGADIILGDHVHVLEPMEKEGGKFIVYSLGNFVSNQRWQYSDSGMILNLTIEKNFEQKKTYIKDVSYIPVWVDTYPSGGLLHYRVVAVEKAIADYENGTDPLLNAQDYERLKQVWEETTTLMSRPEQEIMPVTLVKKPAQM